MYCGKSGNYTVASELVYHTIAAVVVRTVSLCVADLQEHKAGSDPAAKAERPSKESSTESDWREATTLFKEEPSGDAQEPSSEVRSTGEGEPSWPAATLPPSASSSPRATTKGSMTTVPANDHK